MKIKFLILIVSLLILSCSQSTTKRNNENLYKVDPKIEKEIKYHTRIDTSFFHPMEFSTIYHSSLVNSLTDTTLSDTAEVELWYEIKKDTAFIWGNMSGFGYLVKIYGDKYQIFHVINSDRKDFKLDENDSLTRYIEVPCTFTKLTLTNDFKTSQKKGFSGYFELISSYYYHKDLDKNEPEYKTNVAIKGYFLTDSTKKTNII
jgi:hypothetical protein